MRRGFRSASDQEDKSATACIWKPLKIGLYTMENLDKLETVLARLEAVIAARRGADPKSSYTTQLLADPARAAKKFGEEAVETVIAAVQGGQADALAAESADLLYHWLVLLAASGVSTNAVAAKAGRAGRPLRTWRRRRRGRPQASHPRDA